MQDIDIEKKAKSMFQKKEIREEFANDIEVLKAYLANKQRCRVYKAENRQSTKKDATKTADIPSDDELKRKYQNSKSLQDEFGSFESFKSYEKNKSKVRVLHA